VRRVLLLGWLLDSAGETAVDGDEAGVGGRTRRCDDQLHGQEREGL
jgi:hypothetical protein